MDRHTCKLCFRRFHNGRALGGHMRSHVMAASAAAYSPLLSRQPQSPPLSLASTSSTEMDDDKPAAQQEPPPTPCVPREGTKKRFDDSPGFSSGGRAAARGGESSVVQDGESDTESSSPRFAVVSRRRSKRARRRAPPLPPPAAAASDDPEQPAASSVSDATPVEDVAMSLVMLSRDSWTRSSRSGRGCPASSEAAEQNNDDDDDDAVRSFVGAGADDGADHHEDDDVARPPRGGRHHQCGVCRKVFRSYQALGGHRASIKKGKGGCVPVLVPVPVPVPVPHPAAPSSSKAHRAENGGPAAVHECPFCFRVFESGQALGGHKRAHMPLYAAATGTGAPAAPPMTPSPRTPAAKCGDSSGSFDLNVPAAATDDDFELSAVYDTEFGGARQ